jgi:hypothetical protein
VHAVRALAFAAALAAGLGLPAGSTQADELRQIDARVQATMDAFKAVIPAAYFDEAYGYAVLPSVKRIGFGLGGAWGRGLVLEAGKTTGYARFWQVTSGIQSGGRTVSLVVLIRDEEAMKEFRCNRVQFMGQAGFVVGGPGVLKTPAYDDGIAIFALNGFGLMVEATIAAGRFSVHPVSGTQSARAAPATAEADASSRCGDSS